MFNYRLVLAYDGSRYKGWQRLGGSDGSIQGKVESTLSRIIGAETEISGSGRTDAGVHARMQVCSFKSENAIDCADVLTKLRHYLPEDIGALSLEEAEARFHARLSCREKTYVYRIWNTDAPNVFERKFMYRFEPALDIAAMERAASTLLGKHDFSAFCSLKKMKKSPVRTLNKLKVERLGDEVRLTLSGDGFLYNMVRIIAGTLIEVGSGARSEESVYEALISLDRQHAGFTAPAQGLILYDVRY